jgi:hypothetical protein
MNKADIDAAITGAFGAIRPALAIAYPNVKSQHDRPFVELQIQPTGREDTTLKGGGVLREFGIVNAVVVVDLDEGTAEAHGIAEQIRAAFPVGHRIFIDNGEVVFRTPADIRGGFRQGSEWRVPVLLSYLASNASTEE